MFTSIIAFITGFFEFFKEATGLWNSIAPSTSQEIDKDKNKIDQGIADSDKTGRPSA